MVAIIADGLHVHEDRIARLTESAYQAVLESGFRGSFLDLKLSLWSTIRDVVDQEPAARVPDERTLR